MGASQALFLLESSGLRAMSPREPVWASSRHTASCGRSLVGDLGLRHEGLVNPAEAASPLLTHTCKSSLPYSLVANQSLSLAQGPAEGP